MTQMSLHRIIAEIKHLEEKGVALPHVAFFSVDAKNLGSKTVETVLAEGQAAIDSELSKIDRLVKLKVARNKANSTTTLKLGNKEVTIDEALANADSPTNLSWLINNSEFGSSNGKDEKKADATLEFDSTNEGGTSFKEFTLSLADHDEETS